MVDQPAHPITITYWEGDETNDTPFTRLFYCEWTHDGRSYYAHADESHFNCGEGDGDLDEYQDGAGNWSHRGIPLPVRRALAELIFPPAGQVVKAVQDLIDNRLDFPSYYAQLQTILKDYTK